MTARRTTRIAALGAGALLTLGILSAAPAGATDGAQADATAKVGTADVINQSLDILNRACIDANNVVGQAGDAATSALASSHGITVASQQAGTGLNLQVALPALTDALPLDSLLGSLPLLGSVTGQVDAEPLQISCATAADGAGLGLSAAGVDALVQAVAPGVDLSQLNIDVPSVDVSGSTTAGSAIPGPASVSASVAGSIPVPELSLATTAPTPSARVTASAPAAPTSTATAAEAAPAEATPVSTSTSGGTLARTGAGLGVLGLLGTALIGSGRLLGFGRKLLRIG